jgi:cell division protein FtsW (lipid II flippase)
MSGYRNSMAMMGFTYIVGLYYRGGGFSLIVAGFGGMIALIFIALLNMAVPLPDNIQRAFSFMPGTWNEQVTQDTSNSTEWRIEMWKEALLTDFWIHNKILGDGLGFTQQEYNWMKSLDAAKTGGALGSGNLTVQQQGMMITCSYHSGPVSAVRVVGYVGLFIFLLAQIRLAVHAHRQILRCRNTEWYPLSLLLGIPVIWSPAFFWLVFGDFPVNVSAFLMQAAMIRLLETNLPLPAYTKPSRLPYILNAHRNGRQRETIAD